MKPTIDELAKLLEEGKWVTPSDNPDDQGGRFGFEKLDFDPDSVGLHVPPEDNPDADPSDYVKAEPKPQGVKEFEPFLREVMKVKPDQEWPPALTWSEWNGPNPYIELEKEFDIGQKQVEFIVRRVMGLPIDNNLLRDYRAQVARRKQEKELGPASQSTEQKRTSDIKKYIQHLMSVYGMSKDDSWPEPNQTGPSAMNLNPIKELMDKFDLSEEESKEVVTSVMDDELFNLWLEDFEQSKSEDPEVNEQLPYGQMEVQKLAKDLGISYDQAMDMVNKKMDAEDMTKVQAIDAITGKTANYEQRKQDSESERVARLKNAVSKIRQFRKSITKAIDKSKSKDLEKAAKGSKINFSLFQLLPSSYPQDLPGIDPKETDPPTISLVDEVIEADPDVLDEKESFVGILTVWAAAGYKVETGSKAYDDYFERIRNSGQLPNDI